MKKYEEIELEVIQFDSEDIITESGPCDTEGPDICIGD